LDDLTYPQPDRAYTNVGLIYLKIKKYPAAENSFRKALSLNRSNCQAHNYYGQSLYYTKNYERAALALDTAIQLCKNLDEAYYYAALAYIGAGQYSRAETRLEELIKDYGMGVYGELARKQLRELRGSKE